MAIQRTWGKECPLYQMFYEESEFIFGGSIKERKNGPEGHFDVVTGESGPSSAPGRLLVAARNDLQRRLR